MKILLIDDERAKGRKLVPALMEKCGLALEDISLAGDASQGRAAMRSTAFDIVLLDLLLPADAIGEPSSSVSIDLLSEILEETALIKPSAIVGVTRDKAAMIDAAPHFTDALWSIVEVESTSDLWVDRIIKLVNYQKSVSSQEKLEERFLCDVAIVTALATPELRAVHALPWAWEVEEPLDRATIVRRGSFTTSRRSYSVVSTAASRMGMVSTAVVASKIVSVMRPRFLVMTGICAGIESKTKLGDVIFADPCWDYQSGKHAFDNSLGSHFKVAPHQIGLSETVRVRADQLRRDSELWRRIEDEWPARRSDRVSMHVGPLASGSAVVADESILPGIMNQRRDLLGIEMEAYGLLASAQGGGVKPTAFVIKSVCDFASSLKNDNEQDYASYTSARAMRAFFEKYMDELYEMAGD